MNTLKRALCLITNHRWTFIIIDYPKGPGRHRICRRCHSNDQAFNLLSDEIYLLSHPPKNHYPPR